MGGGVGLPGAWPCSRLPQGQGQRWRQGQSRDPGYQTSYFGTGVELSYRTTELSATGVLWESAKNTLQSYPDSGVRELGYLSTAFSLVECCLQALTFWYLWLESHMVAVAAPQVYSECQGLEAGPGTLTLSAPGFSLSSLPLQHSFPPTAANSRD